MKPLPREARDTLFLLATIAATLAPHAGHLPLWCSAITALVLGWRALLAWRSAPLPGRWALLAVLAVVLGLTWLSYRSLLGREPGITLLAMLMALKTLELRARRDAFVVFFLGFFLVLTQFLYSQSLLTALWTLACVWALLSALVLAQMPQGLPSLGLAARIAARNTAWGLPVMLALFLLFPRLPPLWGLPKDAGARTGLSEQMELGAFAELGTDDSIALRLSALEGRLPPQPALYFRAQVLSRFDGRRWEALRPLPPLPGATPPQPRGRSLRYQMTLEPLRLNTVPMLEYSAAAPGTRLAAGTLNLLRGGQGQWLAPRPLTERLRLQHEAWQGVGWQPEASAEQLQPDLSLPPGLNPRSLALGAALRQQHQDLAPAARAQAVSAALLGQIRQQGFSYTLSPGLYGETSPHLVDEFWFDRRLGFCEHFAAAYVVLMRAAGVPARIVTGLQGADPELQDGELVVRMSQAHAWAEIWLPGQGWQRVDPTAAVAPERIQGSPLRPPPGVIAGALNQVNPQLWQQLRGAWESLNHRWQQRVLNFSSGEQLALLKRLGWRDPDWAALVQLAGLLLAGVATAGAAWAAWQRQPHDPWSRQRAWLTRELSALGLQPLPEQTPRHWAQALRQQHGEAAAALAQTLLALEALRYRDDRAVADAAWRAQFKRQSRSLRHQSKKSA